MHSAESKQIFISYADSDRAAAAVLRTALKDYLGESAWVREFDLNAGALVAETIASAIANATWFVLVLSAEAMKSPWIRREANLATFRSLEDHNFHPVVLSLDDTQPPLHLRIALTSALNVAVTDSVPLEDACLQVADYIDRTEPIIRREPFVDRGSDADVFSLRARRNKVIFIAGWAGVGKSAFTMNRVADVLHKKPRQILLTRGHSLDLLSRDIIRACHTLQPIQTDNDIVLLDAALSALETMSDRIFLFLDDAEAGLDVVNKLQPYLYTFLDAFVTRKIATHVVIGTTRNPDYPPSLAVCTDLQRLQPMQDDYIRECIELWLDRQVLEQLDPGELDGVVSLADGHPLAARMIASSLKVLPAAEVLSPGRKARVRMRLAEHILRSIDLSGLDELQQLILQILAAVGEPLRLGDLFEIGEIQGYPVEDVHEAWSSLGDAFLIHHEGELASLHTFIGEYFKSKLRALPPRLHAIRSDFGNFAYNKAIQANSRLAMAMQSTSASDEQATQLSNEVFRYALSATKLLRYMEDEERVAALPIQIKGTLREMVFFFYQEEDAYAKALHYAQRWLKISPDDSEILLYVARCYRRMGDPESLDKAANIVERLEAKYPGKRFLIPRLWREKGLIYQRRGNVGEAKRCFEEGIKGYRAGDFPGNHVGLARVLLNEADDLPQYMSERQCEVANEAAKLLETAREKSAQYDRFTLEAYIEALILADREDEALPMLREVLAERPDDARWNYRMAEVCRGLGALKEAQQFAEKARSGGAQKAPLTLANVCYAWWAKLKDTDAALAETMLGRAATAVEHFVPTSARDREVADSIAAKIYRSQAQWEKAREAVFKYGEPRDPYIVYEQCHVKLWDSTSCEWEGDRDGALVNAREAKKITIQFGAKFGLTDALRELLDKCNERIARLEKREES